MSAANTVRIQVLQLEQLKFQLEALLNAMAPNGLAARLTTYS